MKLSKEEIQDLIEKLQKGENIPEDYKYKLFPTKQKEYELVYGGKMRKEDVLANEDGVFPVPLQVEKIFNGKRELWDDDWKNIIAFGDNLQFLKTIYENKDPLIKDKIKGKVKLIYIDPPFATSDEFTNKEGAKSYIDKRKGAEFVEFLRKRLIVAREILADDGSIYVHLDWKMSHYIKLVLDEVFGKDNFINDIIWNYKGTTNSKKMFARKHDDILLYSKSKKYIFNTNDVRVPYSDTSAYKTDKEGKIYKEWSKEKGNYYPPQKLENGKYKLVGKICLDVFNDIPSRATAHGKEYTSVDYPTQKPESVMERIIKASSNKGDIVLDFFGGSGTTAAVAEKLNRRWITCDIGKLSFYTTQKRILNIEKSKSIKNKNSKYQKQAKSFITVNTGHYDLEKVFNLSKKEYSNFVLNLFEIEPIEKTISGIEIDGKRKDDYYALIWKYWKFKDAGVNEEYLKGLHSYIGKYVGDRLYIVAPASYVDFISDYYEINNVRYYFLKVPYYIIKELHKVQFKKFRQPQSKKNVNDLEDAIGFHFMKQPDVETEVTTTKKDVEITIKKFHSDFSEDDKGKELENLESLAMVLIDKDFDGQTFDMNEYYFVEDLLPKKKNIEEELKGTKEIILPSISKIKCGKTLMIIYVDIFGNEFKEKFEIA